MTQAQFAARDRSAGALFGNAEPQVLHASSSEPSVVRSAGKENSFGSNRFAPNSIAANERHYKRATIRNSSRNIAVKVSGPTKVDQPKDSNEVNRQADNWRQMARYLQEHLSDPTGARQLFKKAIQHRENHGLWCTTQNAQVHVDLARSLSKADQMHDAESHLRHALRIYDQIEPGKEHVADLVLYVGVVVDRQRRRPEAEALYRKALQMYKENVLPGNNVDIAFKNLSLCLRKQNRENEISNMRSQLYDWKRKINAVAGVVVA